MLPSFTSTFWPFTHAPETLRSVCDARAMPAAMASSKLTSERTLSSVILATVDGMANLLPGPGGPAAAGPRVPASAGPAAPANGGRPPGGAGQERGRGRGTMEPDRPAPDGATLTPIPDAALSRRVQPAATPPELLRNFCIIAHIDHGKSTLADRMLQLTGVVDERVMREQYLDRMDIERERGITIKSQAVRMTWAVAGPDGALVPYALNMIDTPGHVDFTYEVSRSLAACEGAVLLVDAAQGIEAQTLANLYLAMENDLAIIPVLNKIDLPAAQPERYAEEIAGLVGGNPEDVLRVSGKTGEGVPALLDRIVATVPAPVGDANAPARAMIFDSVYDTYRGVVTYVRVVDGEITPRERIAMMSTKATHELLEIGVISPEPVPTAGLGVGEVGYLITGVKDVRQSKVGDTVTDAAKPASTSLPGYADPK